MTPMTVRNLAIAVTVVVAALTSSVSVARAQLACFTCLNKCSTDFAQCVAGCPPPDTPFGTLCESRCEVKEVLCSFRCQDTQCLATGAGLGGFWEELTQSCTGAGESLRCSLQGIFIVVNPGTETAPHSTLLFVLSKNRNLDPNDTILDRVPVGALQPGEQKRRALNVDLPEGVRSSGQFAIAVLDAEADVFEPNEKNNIIPSERID